MKDQIGRLEKKPETSYRAATLRVPANETAACGLCRCFVPKSQ
jgi:hypothetical protein